MALILKRYLDYFVYGRCSYLRYTQGEQSYFDPVERCFLRIVPSRGEVAKEHWIRLPVIHEADLLKRALRASNYEWLIEKYADQDEIGFCIGVVSDMDSLNLDFVPEESLTVYYNQLLQKWAEDNNIPNWKLDIVKPVMEIENWEDVKKCMKLIDDMEDAEKLQEEEFKRSMKR